MTRAEIETEILEQAAFVERLTPHGDAWNIAADYLRELWGEYLNLLLSGALEA